MGEGSDTFEEWSSSSSQPWEEPAKAQKIASRGGTSANFRQSVSAKGTWQAKWLISVCSEVDEASPFACQLNPFVHLPVDISSAISTGIIKRGSEAWKGTRVLEDYGLLYV